jgi:hypothetical protein
LKHVIDFAGQATETRTTSTLPPPPPAPTTTTKKNSTATIRNQVIRMEMPRTDDDEQQQLVETMRLLSNFCSLQGDCTFSIDENNGRTDECF